MTTNTQSALTGRCAAALLANMAEHGFTPALTYRTRAHALNNKEADAAHCDMLATIAVHRQGGMEADAAALGLRVRSIGRVRSCADMQSQIDDLMTFLMGFVEAGQVEATAKEFVYFTRMGVDTRIRRYSTSKDDTKQSELLADGVWVSSMLTIGMAKRMLAASPELEVDYRVDQQVTAPEVTYIRVGNGKVYRVTDGETYTDFHLGGTDWEAVSVTAALLINGVATGKFDEVCNPEELEKEEAVERINTATALLAGDLCRLIEKRGLGGGLPLVSMLEHVHMLNPVARKVKEELFDILDGKNGVCREDVDSMRFLVDCHCCGWVTPALFVERWSEAHYKLNAIALGAKP